MANRRNYFKEQEVTEAELDAGFDGLELADRDLAGDMGFVGIAYGGTVSATSPEGLSVQISGPGCVYDQDGQRVAWSALQTKSLATDDLGASTDVTTPGNHKIIALFAKFKRALSDPRVDGDDNTVYFVSAESFEFSVVQGVEATEPTPPSLASDKILLADITRHYDDVTIGSGDISTARRQWMFAVAGSPNSITRGTAEEAISDLVGWLNSHITGAAGAHAATAVSFTGGTTWKDGSGISGTTVQAAIDEVVSDLGGNAGASRIACTARSDWKDGGPNPTGDSILAALDRIVDDLSDDAGADKIGVAARSAWYDSTTNPAGVSVLGALQKIVDDLGTLQGAAKIGCSALGSWRGGRYIGENSVRGMLQALVIDLGAQVSGDDGSERVGAYAKSGSPTSLSTGSVSDQIAALLAAINARVLKSGDTVSGSLSVTGTLTGGTVVATAKIKPTSAADLELHGNASYLEVKNAGGTLKAVRCADPAADEQAVTRGWLEKNVGVYRNANQTIPSGSPTLLTFESATYDTDSMWSAGQPHRLVATTAGKYHVSISAWFVCSSVGIRRLALYKSSGGQVACAMTPGHAAQDPGVCVSMDVQLSAGTYVYAYAYQDSGGNLDINAAVASMHRIGA